MTYNYYQIVNIIGNNILGILYIVQVVYIKLGNVQIV